MRDMVVTYAYKLSLINSHARLFAYLNGMEQFCTVFRICMHFEECIVCLYDSVDGGSVLSARASACAFIHTHSKRLCIHVKHV